MLLKQIEIKDFKRIKKVNLSLADLNIIVGTNGCGKSSIIQAVHLATCLIRQADRIDPNKTSTVGIETLDYLPTDSYSLLGYKATWGNKVGSPSSCVSFSFKTEENNFLARCELRSARNAGISITGQIPRELAGLLRADQKFFSAYIPGISGIPNREEKKSRKVVLKSCSYGDSNVILRNVLLLLKNQNQLQIIEQWITEIVGPLRISIQHREDRDLFIECNVELDGIRRPLELIGTGFLQLIQLFSYILLFKPGILLIDEPDIHLHPSVQEKLVRKLEDVAREQRLRILMTTHSPFIVRAASPDAQVFWVKDGALESENRDQVEIALGWGAFGKKVIIISEDSKTSFLRKLIAQWPSIDRVVTFYPGTGFRHLPTAAQAKEISDSLGGKYRILVHRDRDSITQAEYTKLTNEYWSLGINFWMPPQSDVEAYFCSPSFISELTGTSLDEARDALETILTRNSLPIKDQFEKQRASHNAELYKAGGSPSNDQVWSSLQTSPLRGAKGKYVFGQLKNHFAGGKFSEAAISKHQIQSQIAVDLYEALMKTIDSNIIEPNGVSIGTD